MGKVQELRGLEASTPLEWHSLPIPFFSKAETVFGRYLANRNGLLWYLWLPGQAPETHNPIVHDNHADHSAAAQSDYDARALAEISSPPVARRSSSDEAEVVAVPRDLLQLLYSYGSIHTVEGVVYPHGSHKESLDRVAALLASPPPSVATGGVTEEMVERAMTAYTGEPSNDMRDMMRAALIAATPRLPAVTDAAVHAALQTYWREAGTPLSRYSQGDQKQMRLALTAALAVGDEGMGEGWRDWPGGDCPFSDPVVEYRRRDGVVGQSEASRLIGWLHVGRGSDIVGYRLLPTLIQGDAK